LADEVEHIRPKDLYPDYVFRYDNYLMSCGACNTRKGATTLVSNGNVVVPYKRLTGSAVNPPPAGTFCFLDPFSVDPLRFLVLDLVSGSFLFLPSHPLGTWEHEAARETVDLLGLNSREELVQRRAQAFSGFLAVAREFADPATTAGRQAQLRTDFQQADHPTVWAEMKRQRSKIPALSQLFVSAPALLTT
jgi:hypothetical protein